MGEYNCTTTEAIELPDKFSHHLRCIRNNVDKFSDVKCSRMNVLASPACYIRMHTQVMYMRKYHIRDWMHMNTCSIKRYEQEALSLFHTEVAPAFVFTKNDNNRRESSNRFSRVCVFCKLVYNDLYVNDAFHVLFKCPMVAKERIALFNTLNDTCGADEWVRTNTLCDLGVVLLSPQSIDVACAVGRFLSEYLAARDVLFCCVPFSTSPKSITSSRWLGGRNRKLDELRSHISDTLNKRMNSNNPLQPNNTCVFSSVWITWHSCESLGNAFKPIHEWLHDGWQSRLEKNGKTVRRSIACI